MNTELPAEGQAVQVEGIAAVVRRQVVEDGHTGAETDAGAHQVAADEAHAAGNKDRPVAEIVAHVVAGGDQLGQDIVQHLDNRAMTSLFRRER